MKSELVIKGGYAAWGALGEGNASIPGSQPTIYRAHWGGHGLAAASLSANFVSAAAAEGEFRPRIDIDPRTVEIRIDGAPLPALPGDDLPLNRRYFLM